MMIQPPDDDQRTNSMGLFNTAEAFRLSAMALEDEKVKIGHAASPIRICYYHALELYLKALLRQKHSVKKIKEKFGHNTKRLVEEAEALGLVVTRLNDGICICLGEHFAIFIRNTSEQERRIGRSLKSYGTPASACGMVLAISCSKQACRCGYDCRPRRRRLLLLIV